jgi:small subunit ribosomal protein S16
VLEELGTYDPMVHDVDARALLNAERIDYWLGVGAQPSDRVRVLIKKYGSGGTHADAQRTARERLASPKAVPDAGAPVYVRPAKDETPAPVKAQAEATASEPADAAETTDTGEGEGASTKTEE